MQQSTASPNVRPNVQPVAPSRSTIFPENRGRDLTTLSGSSLLQNDLTQLSGGIKVGTFNRAISTATAAGNVQSVGPNAFILTDSSVRADQLEYVKKMISDNPAIQNIFKDSSFPIYVVFADIGPSFTAQNFRFPASPQNRSGSGLIILNTNSGSTSLPLSGDKLYVDDNNHPNAARWTVSTFLNELNELVGQSQADKLGRKNLVPRAEIQELHLAVTDLFRIFERNEVLERSKQGDLNRSTAKHMYSEIVYQLEDNDPVRLAENLNKLYQTGNYPNPYIDRNASPDQQFKQATEVASLFNDIFMKRYSEMFKGFDKVRVEAVKDQNKVSLRFVAM
jgi:hypothetical protein